ncbi:MAG: hypothetical protein V7K98_04705 [Nostoc sp.]|uniref:hypothetical protein n=1 Tax=Nostoc sp. TaxID=1180 RepID=UPI002FFCCBD1
MNILQKLLIIILVVLLCISLIVCYWGGNIFPLLLGEKIWLHKNPDVMEKEILYTLPVGSSVDKAKVIMKQNGFKCEEVQNGVYYRYRDIRIDYSKGTKHSHVNFLDCKINRPSLINTEYWWTQIEYKDESVTHISVSYRNVGI